MRINSILRGIVGAHLCSLFDMSDEVAEHLRHLVSIALA